MVGHRSPLRLCPWSWTNAINLLSNQSCFVFELNQPFIHCAERRCLRDDIRRPLNVLARANRSALGGGSTTGTCSLVWPQIRGWYYLIKKERCYQTRIVRTLQWNHFLNFEYIMSDIRKPFNSVDPSFFKFPIKNHFLNCCSEISEVT